MEKEIIIIVQRYLYNGHISGEKERERKSMCWHDNDWCCWLMENGDSFESIDLTWLLIRTVDVVNVVVVAVLRIITIEFV